jgi:hypothetical protein
MELAGASVIDIAARKPRKLDLEMQLHTDSAVTMRSGGCTPAGAPA